MMLTSTLIQYTAWFELTKANRGKVVGLGDGTFSDAVKRLVAKGGVRKVGDLYQVVIGAGVEGDEAEGDEATSGPALGGPFCSARSTGNFIS